MMAYTLHKVCLPIASILPNDVVLNVEAEDLALTFQLETEVQEGNRIEEHDGVHESATNLWKLIIKTD
jgi:hypothetical protein